MLPVEVEAPALRADDFGRAAWQHAAAAMAPVRDLRQVLGDRFHIGDSPRTDVSATPALAS